MPMLSLVPDAASQLALPASSTSLPCSCAALRSAAAALAEPAQADRVCDASWQQQAQPHPDHSSLDRRAAPQVPALLLDWTKPCRLRRPRGRDSW